MSIQLLRDSLNEYAKDIRLNLGSVLTEEGAPGLSAKQIWGIALSCAYATKEGRVIEATAADASSILLAEEREAAKGAATIMAMNNVYYRTSHLAEEKEWSKLPAKLRMNFLAKPGVAKVDFELYSLAVSCLSGCGACINAHIKEVKAHGVADIGIQSCIRIAATIQATAQAIVIG